jgi:hypothetical protein
MVAKKMLRRQCANARARAYETNAKQDPAAVKNGAFCELGMFSLRHLPRTKLNINLSHHSNT